MTDLVPRSRTVDTSAGRAVILATTTRTGHTVAALIAAWLGSFTESQDTRAAYGRDLQRYLEWCVSRDLDPLTMRLPEVQMFAVALAGMHGTTRTGADNGRPLSAKSRARILAAVSSWYTFLCRAGVLDANPARDVKRPRYDRRHSPTSSVVQHQATMMKAAAATPRRGKRGRPSGIGPECAAIIFGLLVDLGARVSELVNADDEHLGHRDGFQTITLHMKGGKTRTRPIPAPLVPTLDRYLKTRPSAAPGSEQALLRTKTGKRITRHQVYGMVQRLAELAGVPNWKKITPHSMRHAFNSIAKALGVDIEFRREALGHSTVAITELYDHVALSIAQDPAHLVAAATALPADETSR